VSRAPALSATIGGVFTDREYRRGALIDQSLSSPDGSVQHQLVWLAETRDAAQATSASEELALAIGTAPDPTGAVLQTSPDQTSLVGVVPRGRFLYGLATYVESGAPLSDDQVTRSLQAVRDLQELQVGLCDETTP